MTTPDPRLATDACRACGATCTLRDRIRCDGPPIEAVACSSCGEWWLESANSPVTGEALRRVIDGS